MSGEKEPSRAPVTIREDLVGRFELVRALLDSVDDDGPVLKGITLESCLDLAFEAFLDSIIPEINEVFPE